MENVKTLLFFFIGVIVVLLYRSCDNHKETKPTNKIIEQITDTIFKVDTLIKTKTITRNKEVEKLVPYQHIVYVPNKELCKDTTKLDSLKTLTLSQSKIIKDDSTIFVLFNKKDSLYVKKDKLKDKYIDSLVTQTHKKGWLKPFVKGYIAGFTTREVIEVVK